MAKQYNNYSSLIDFTRASSGTALRPISYGDELVVNGTFDTDLNGWMDVSIGTGTVTVASGRMETYRADLTNRGVIWQEVTTEVGKNYTVTFNATGAGGRFRVGSSLSGGEYVLVASAYGDYQITFTANTTTTYIYVDNNVNGSTASWDNISVREVLFDQPDGTLTLFNHPTNIPRIEYDADGNRLGLLVEESRTNLLTYSEDFSSYDTVGTVTRTGDYTLAPDGSLSATRAVFATSNASSQLFKVFSSSATTYSTSMWIKSNTVNGNMRFGFYDGSNVLTDVISITTEWTRFEASKTLLASAGSRGVWLYPNGNITDVSIWGAQVEQGSFPTSYIPSNSGSTTTRSADVASIDVSEFGWNNKAGTVVAEVDTADASSFGILWSANADSFDNRTLAYINNDLIYMYNRKNSGAEVNDAFANAPLDNTPLKHGYAFTDGDFNHTLNGATVESVASNEMPVGINSFDIGNRLYTTGGHLNGHIKSLRYFPRRLSNAQLQELTS